MTDDERKEEHRKWMAAWMKKKLDSMRLHPAPYRLELGMTLELHKKREFQN